MQFEKGKPYLLSFAAAGEYQLIMLDDTRIELTDLRSRSYVKQERQKLPAKVLSSDGMQLKLTWKDASEGEEVTLTVHFPSGSANARVEDCSSGDVSNHQGTVGVG